jgi:transglutaminase-like putative cysteine protease
MLAPFTLFAVAMTMMNTPGGESELSTTGASVVWTQDDQAARRLRELLEQGKFTEARRWLPGLEDKRLREEGLDMMRRIERDFSLDTADVLAQLRESIPDAGEADVIAWTRSGELQHRLIDGESRYFQRAVANLLRFNVEAQRRRDAARERSTLAPSTDRHGAAFTLNGHLEQLVAEAARSDASELMPIRTRMTYTLTVPGNARGAKPGSLLRVWLPMPKPFGPQRDVRLVSASPEPKFIAPENAPQRTAYFEVAIADPSSPQRFEMVVEYTTAARYPRLDPVIAKGLPPDWGDRWLQAREPHIVVNDEMRAMARSIVGDEKNPLEQARLLFEWMDREIRWCNEIEYSIIPSLPRKLLATRRGDCGVQSLLYISLCRSLGIPARWQSGWTTDPFKGGNLHDWTEIYVEPWGWIAVDPSYGRKQHADPRVRDFYFGHLDAYRMIVNSDYGAPLEPAKKSLRSEPLDFQRGEVEIDGVNLYFNEWSYEARFEHAPLKP